MRHALLLWWIIAMTVWAGAMILYCGYRLGYRHGYRDGRELNYRNFRREPR